MITMRQIAYSRKRYIPHIQKDIVLVDLMPSEARGIGSVAVHHGLRSLASFLRIKGHTAEILFNLDPFLPPARLQSHIVQRIIRIKPLLLGFSPFQNSEEYSQNDISKIEQIVTRIHRAAIHPYVIFGGHYASFNHREFMRDFSWVDFVVRGEGEETLCELLSAMEGKTPLNRIDGLTYREGATIMVNPPRANLKNLDMLPLPAMDHLEAAKKAGMPIRTYFIGSSRGCYGRCSFCSVRGFYRLSPSNSCWRPRSPQNVVDEMELVNKKYGCTNFGFQDDNFMGPGLAGKRRAQEIAREILRRRLKITFMIACRANDIEKKSMMLLKRAGMNCVAPGLESGSEEDLKTYCKDVTPAQNRNAMLLLKRLKISGSPYMIFLNPYSTYNAIKQNIEFIYFLDSLKNIAWKYWYELKSPYLSVYSGIPLRERLERDGLLKGNYISGYTYDFREKGVAHVQRAIDYFMGITGGFNSLIRHVFLSDDDSRIRRVMPGLKGPDRMKVIERLSSMRRDVCFYGALETAREIVAILEGPHPETIATYMRELRGRLREVNLWIKKREAFLQ